MSRAAWITFQIVGTGLLSWFFLSADPTPEFPGPPNVIGVLLISFLLVGVLTAVLTRLWGWLVRTARRRPVRQSSETGNQDQSLLTGRRSLSQSAEDLRRRRIGQ